MGSCRHLLTTFFEGGALFVVVLARPQFAGFLFDQRGDMVGDALALLFVVDDQPD